MNNDTTTTVTGTDADGTDQSGTVARWMNRADRRARVTLGDGSTVTLSHCTNPDGSDLFPTDDGTGDGIIHTGNVADAVADAVADDQGDTVREYRTLTAPDGSQTVVYTNGRTLHIAAPTALTHQGVAVSESFGRRGTQSPGRVTCDGSDIACQGIVCQGQTQAANKFPTVSGSNPRVRLNVCRSCNSARLAGSGQSARDRTQMAN